MPISTSSPLPPRERVVAGAADQDVVAVAAIGDELDAAMKAGGLMTSSPPRPLMTSLSPAPASVMFTSAARPVTVMIPFVLVTVMTSLPAVALMRDGVRGAVIGAEVEIDLADIGPGHIVDRDVVGAAESVEVDVLDAVEVHRDVGDVAGEPGVAAIGRDVDVLVDIGTVEQQRVGTLAAFDGVAAVAGIPDEGIVAGAHIGDIIAASADHGVVAGAAGDGVVAVAAIDGEVGELTRLDRGGVDDVVAGAAVDGERVAGIGVGDRDLRRKAVDHDRSAAVDDRDVVVAGRSR